MFPINQTTPSLTLELSFTVTNLMRWMLTSQMQTNIEAQANIHGDVAMVEMHRMYPVPRGSNPRLRGLGGGSSPLPLLAPRPHQSRARAPRREG